MDESPWSMVQVIYTSRCITNTHISSILALHSKIYIKTLHALDLHVHIMLYYTRGNAISFAYLIKVMYTDHPLVVSAPTGSGKTAVFELAIVRLLMQTSMQQMYSIKIIYGRHACVCVYVCMCVCVGMHARVCVRACVRACMPVCKKEVLVCFSPLVAPMKALCSERYEDWKAKFGPLGLRCAELTGDSQLDDYFGLQNAQIVMTTPVSHRSCTDLPSPSLPPPSLSLSLPPFLPPSLPSLPHSPSHLLP